MTEETLAALEREHVRGDCVGANDEPHCAAFGAHGDGCADWPCDVATLVAEVRRLQDLVPPLGSIVVTNPCDRCLHDRITHLDIESMACDSPCDCPGFVPLGVEGPA